MPDTTIYLKDYQAYPFEVEQVDLDFDLYEDHALVSNSMQLKRVHPGDLRLYGDDLTLVGIEVDGKPLTPDEFYFDGQDLIVRNCPDTLAILVITRIFPQDNSQLSGLYRSNQLFCTQCEAQGFRRISYFPDRPDVLSIFTTSIRADKSKYPVLLSNGNRLREQELPNGRHQVIWQDPFKKPSYLFALVAGTLVCVEDFFTTASGRNITLRIFVEQGNEDKCDYAMLSLKKAMRWDEIQYGREYDLDIFMIVAVSDFNMGAMENKGLNIFNSKYILARPDTATDQDYAGIESVVAHEYFHNWTGNRVTCRDWFQLSLKEGLTVFRDQEFSRDMNSRDVNRLDDVKMLLSTQFPEDAGSMAHPVRPQSYQEINNFYTATIYNKGAEVIRMQHTLLGAEGFRRGMDLYFNRHDGQAVTIDDFVAAMEDANSVDFSQLKNWYCQAGTPEVTATIDYQNPLLHITLKQFCPTTPDGERKLPFLIPIRIAAMTQEGEPLALKQDVLSLTEFEQTFTFESFEQRPIISLLRDFSAPVKLFCEYSESDLLALLQFDDNGYTKWDAAQRLILSCIHKAIEDDYVSLAIPDNLVEALRHVLRDHRLDASLRAELLMPPSFEEIVANLHNINVDQVEYIRRTYRQQLGRALFDDLLITYEMLWDTEDHALDGQAFGRRKLRNLCLSLLMKAHEHQILPLCQQQYNEAQTMSDRITSFALLSNSEDKTVRESVTEDFYQQWKDEDLVVDKWFAIQASSEQPHTLQRVQQLLQHPAFSLKKPNKVRALISTFCHANPAGFHAANGEGYDFLCAMLIEVDKINAQIAARLATPFTRWQRYDEKRQGMMQFQLQRLSAMDLSRDLREIVEKSLRKE